MKLEIEHGWYAYPGMADPLLDGVTASFGPGWTGVVGASGVVFTFILLSSVTGLRDGEVPLTFILVAVLYFGQQIYGAIFVHDNISYLGHIAGGVVGAAVGFLLPTKRQPTSGYGII